MKREFHIRLRNLAIESSVRKLENRVWHNKERTKGEEVRSRNITEKVWNSWEMT